MKRILPLIALGAVAGYADCAFAQRASENPLASAQDAFGTTVGNESIGLYTARDVRGFDPVQAGNVRLEGLYFDRQLPNPNEILTSSLVSGSTVRVGLTAQSYLFPAPSGIADVRLRIPGDKQVNSVVAAFGPYTKLSLEGTSDIPLIAGKLSTMVGIGLVRDDNQDASKPKTIAGAMITRWRPTDRLEFIPFWSKKNSYGMNARANITTAGPYLPPEVPRHVFVSQDWARNQTRDSNFGFIANTAITDDWRFRLGLFRSLLIRKRFFNSLFQNTLPDGTSDHTIVAYPSQHFGSYSGEARLSGVMATEGWRHTVHFALRGRSVRRNFGGSDSKFMGRINILDVPEFAMPAYVAKPQNHDQARQGTAGVAYEGLITNFGEFSVGVQKTFYKRTLTPGTGLSTVIKNTPVLPSATLALYATPDITVFASFTRGLEESGEAPNTASNRGDALPAVRTEQVDAGIRYKLTPRLTAVAALFQVKKPYLSFDASNLFTEVGNVRHRGLEFSIAGRVTESLRVVAGSIFLQARVSGDAVDRGIIGHVPLGRTPRFSNLDLEYEPKSWGGFSADLQVENRSSRVGSHDNIARIPGITLMNLGARYRFKLEGAPATLRFQVRNLFDTFGWDINANQLAFNPVEKRRFSLQLAVDF